ncbi:MAG TPA: HAD-IA family hydrolase [Actinomycetota bacterium]
MTYTAVFFDAGETLVHPYPSFPDLFAEILRGEGFEVSADAVRAHGHVVFDRFEAAARTNELWTTSPERSRRFWHEVYDIVLAELDIPNSNGLVDVVYAAFTDSSNYRLFDDVVPVIDRLGNEGLTLGIVSNFEVWLERLLDELGVRDAFDVCVISGVEGIEKPDPAIFRLAMDRAGVPPERSVYVGDNPRFDVDPARDAGMLPVLIDRRERFPDAPPPRIESLSALPAVLGLS